MKEKISTMDDVAKMVGVSKTTISRYLKGELKYMSKNTAQQIENAINTLNYRPNKIAQNLKTKKTGTIAFSISDMGNPFFSLVIKGIQKEVQKKGYQLLITDSNNSIEAENKNLISFIDNNVEGIIINTVGENKKFLKSFIKKYNKPVVLFDRMYDEIFCDSVTNNNFEATYELLEAINKFYYDKIIFISKPTQTLSTRSAREKAIDSFVINYNKKKEKVISKFKNLKLFSHRIKKILEDISVSNEKVCFFALNEEVLEELILVLNDSNISIGKDIGIVSFSNEKWSKFVTPGITCIDQNPYLMGIETCKLLFDRIENMDKDIEYKEIKCNIFIKNSTQ